jgi:hypothetical protein
MLADVKSETELSNLQRAVLEANRTFSEHRFLRGTSQTLVENEWVYDKLRLKIKSRAVRLSEARSFLLAGGFLMITSGRVELTDRGRLALEARVAPSVNGNGSLKSAPLSDGLDTVTRRQLDRLVEILACGNRGWYDLGRLTEDYGISRGLCYNAAGLQPELFAIRDGRLFLVGHKNAPNASH